MAKAAGKKEDVATTEEVPSPAKPKKSRKKKRKEKECGYRDRAHSSDV